MPLPYGVPDIQDNPDGWGPCSVPEHLKDMPFAPFSKGDKLGKAADWTQQAYQKFPGARAGGWHHAACMCGRSVHAR
jgi:translation initiation factor 3 subunit D